MTESENASYWDAVADTFDEEPDHGLHHPDVRAAWAARLRAWLPDTAADVLDLGCGTGSLALLATEQGHRVTGVDRSARMIERAAAKLGASMGGAGAAARVLVGDATEPPVGDGRFDVVLVRHVLWALPDPHAALRRWARLLRPGGRLVMVEGRWGESSPVGFTADALAELVAPIASRTHVEQLGHDRALWGREVHDERFVVIAHPTATRRHSEIVDVHLILRRDDRMVLGRRVNTGYADGLLHAPSGHVEDGEDVREALIREAREEIGVVIDPADVRVALVMQHCAPDGQPRTGWFFEVSRWEGEATNREPGKCSQLDWFRVDALPDDMVAYCRAAIDAYRKGESFVLHWHRPGDAIAYDPQGPARAVPLPHNEWRNPSTSREAARESEDHR